MLGQSQNAPAEEHANSSRPTRRPFDADPATPLPQRGDRELQRTIESELVPRMLMAHRVSPSSPAQAASGTRILRDADVADFLHEVIGTDDAAAPTFVRKLLDQGVAVESIFMDLLAPTARELGIMWEDDECSFVDVTVALGRLQRVLRELSQTFQSDADAAPESEGHVLLTCLPGEQHTLGLILVAEFLMRDGFRVIVGSPWTEEDLLEQVRSQWFDVIGFSAGCDSKIGHLKREIVRIRSASKNPNVRILVGGQVFSLEHGLVARVGADGWARDARDASTVVRNLVATGAVVSHPLDSSSYDDTGSPRETVRRQ